MASTMSLVLDSSSSSSPSHSRNHSTSHRHRPRIQWTTALLFLFASFACTLATASPEPALPTETLVMDTRVPVKVDGKWVMLSQEEHHHLDLMAKRAAQNSEAPTATSAAVTTTFTVSVSVSVSSTSSSTSSAAAPASPLPSPLDGSLSANFSTSSTGTNNCPTFLNLMLGDPTFKQCYPFSLLMQGSRSFFESEKSLVSITQVLDASCAADVNTCTVYLNQVAKNLTDPSNCGADYQLGNSVVVQTYVAMLAYQSVYSATCLKDPDSAAYCFGRAVTNLTNPSSVYVYFLPLNISLPGSSIPSCSWCLQKTMGIFHSSAANRALPIANTYVSAAQQVDTICGPTFVNSTLPNAIVTDTSAATMAFGPSALLFAVPLLAVLQLLLT